MQLHIESPLGTTALSACDVPRDAVPGLLAALFYASTSVAISLLNKALLSNYSFSCYFFMLAAQLTMTLTFSVMSRDRFGNPFRIPPFDAGVYRVSLPMAVAYLANVCLGLLGLQLVNVPMFFAIRRTAAAFILILEYFLLGRAVERPVARAVGMIVAGALVAGSESLSADLTGYAITAANNVATAATSILQKQFADSSAKLVESAADKDESSSSDRDRGGGGGTGFGPFGTMYYQALTALPACIFLSIATGEVRTLIAYQYLFDFKFWVGFVLASGLGLLLSFSSLLCTTLNSPLATSIAGNAKDVLLTVTGAIAFPGFKATPTSIVGLLLSFTGSAIYSLSSLRKVQASALASAPAMAATFSAASGGLPSTMGGSEGGDGGSLGIHLPLQGGGGGGGGGGLSGGPLGLAFR